MNLRTLASVIKARWICEQARVAPAKFGNLGLAAAAYNADPQRRAGLARFANGPGCFSSDRFAMCYPGLRWLFYTRRSNLVLQERR